MQFLLVILPSKSEWAWGNTKLRTSISVSTVKQENGETNDEAAALTSHQIREAETQIKHNYRRDRLVRTPAAAKLLSSYPDRSL
ncbi:hypothetical protein ACLB2K_044853 [Fragaria x ananassa]